MLAWNGMAQAVGRRANVDGAVAELRLLMPLLVLTVAYVLAVRLVAELSGLGHMFALERYGTPMVGTTVLVMLCGAVSYAAYLGLVVRERRPLARFWRRIVSQYVTAPAFLRLFLSLLLLPLFVSAFTSFKTMIPVLHPFAFDEAFAVIDRVVHFGIDPWRITYAVIGDPIPTFVLVFLYGKMWFVIMWLFFIFNLLWIRDGKGYARFALTWVLCWIVVGSLLALALSSAGPVYYDKVVPGAPELFAPLMERLQHAETTFAEMGLPAFSVISTQDYLWTSYLDFEADMGTGISAMPSMHVAIAVLMALRARQIHRWLGWIFWGYAAIVMIGSVHLAWHYAIDGYLAAIVTILLWSLSGRLTDRTAPTSPPSGSATHSRG